MKKSFSQPFKYARFTTAYLLIETREGFFQYLRHDEPYVGFYDVLILKLDETEEPDVRLAKFLHENGFSLTRYRELVRETSVAFSFIDDTPGSTADEACFHVCTDRTNKPLDGDIRFVSLSGLLDDSSGSTNMVRLGVAQLLNERNITG